MPERRLARIVLGLECLLVFHSPDGSELWVESDIIKVIRPVGNAHREHIAPGTHSVLYLAVRPAGFGLTETAAQVLRKIESCGR